GGHLALERLNQCRVRRDGVPRVERAVEPIRVIETADLDRVVLLDFLIEDHTRQDEVFVLVDVYWRKRLCELAQAVEAAHVRELERESMRGQEEGRVNVVREEPRQAPPLLGELQSDHAGTS